MFLQPARQPARTTGENQPGLVPAGRGPRIFLQLERTTWADNLAADIPATWADNLAVDIPATWADSLSSQLVFPLIFLQLVRNLGGKLKTKMEGEWGS